MNDLLHAFPGQQVNEPVFVFARPYFIAFLPTAAIFFFVFALSLVGEYFLTTSAFSFTATNLNIILASLGLFQLFVLVVFFIAVFDFYFDIIIVTNRRLVDIDQEQLFFRRISELSLEDVQDVSSQQQGFLQTIFNYGQVEVQTAGTRPNFIFDNVYFPREIAAVILNLAEQASANIEAVQRFPTYEVVGVINNKVMKNVNDLQDIGAYPIDATQ